ncbi:hypothetical protein PDESU_01230 [Pontiella desulfatans]|uniref:Glycosyl hydrolases family 2 sugar binding domain-containing protein n=1 Tax=Pontiella desulfatans TaxID=2750659 RepID=A0A6C2TYI5_PONDE|nr:glycosyl hydrolase [Pontiella desulfatans]VGO12677.1 hypothetical protein PDESU_01230 [Pontiella desulfatans]
MKKFIIRLVISMLPMAGMCRMAGASLEQSFQSPPDSARAQTWWHWMNGNVSAEGITKDLEAMKDAGLNGFTVFDVPLNTPRGPVNYNSPKWHEMIAHTVKEADRIGLEMTFHNCAGWSSSGGPWITPEHSMHEVVWSEVQVSGGKDVSITLTQSTTRKGYYQDIVVLAFPTPEGEQNGKPGFRIENWEEKSGKNEQRGQNPHAGSEFSPSDLIAMDGVLNLTDRMTTDGKLAWTAPKGHYTIVRFGYTTRGKTNHPAARSGQGLECDKLSKAGADLHWNRFLTNVLADAGPLTGKSLKRVLIDSYEVGLQNWTHDFAQQFKARRGYDMTPWMPCMTGRVVGSLELSERFLWDLRRTIMDLMTENYFGRFAELCHQKGLTLSIEPYGNGGFDHFQAAAVADVPIGEFWTKRHIERLDMSMKLTASAAHMGDKRYVGAEAYTAMPEAADWKSHPYSMKAEGDLAYAEGINRYIFHTFAHQPFADDIVPGMTMGRFGMQMNRNNTWFMEARPWFDRLARCQYLLQEGQFVADLLYIHGEGVQRNEVRKSLSPVPPDGYDYDVGGFDALMDLRVEDGRLVLPSGMSYRVLVLTRMPTARPELMTKLAELVRQGAIVVGEKPVGSPSLENYPDCDKQVETIAASLWDSGRVEKPENLPAVLKQIDLVPDFEVSGEANLAYIHRRIDGKDVYFVSNQDALPSSVRCRFRVAGRTPELWHPDTGRIEAAPVWKSNGATTEVALELDPAGSVFVVFDRPVEQVNPIAEITFRSAEEAQSEEEGLTIVRAWYGNPNDPQQRVDLTEKLAKRAALGQTVFTASNKDFGDPANKIEKVLEMEYVANGVSKTVRVNENQSIDVSQALAAARPEPVRPRIVDGEEQILVFSAGTLDVRRASGTSATVDVPEVAEPLAVNGPWTVSFGKLGPEAPVVFKSLIPLNEHEDEEIKYFSGAATYRTEFHYSAADSASAILDLGRVEVMARVKLNGTDLGLLWKPPFRADITGAVREGRNELEVTVVNLWANRLIGDEQYPDVLEYRGPTASVVPDWLRNGTPRPATERKTVTLYKHLRKNSSLVDSGLIGPVRVLRPQIVPFKDTQR